MRLDLLVILPRAPGACRMGPVTHRPHVAPVAMPSRHDEELSLPDPFDQRGHQHLGLRGDACPRFRCKGHGSKPLFLRKFPRRHDVKPDAFTGWGGTGTALYSGLPVLVQPELLLQQRGYPLPGQFHIEQRLQASSLHDRPSQRLIRHHAAAGKFIIDDPVPAPGGRPIHPVELAGHGKRRRPLRDLYRHLPFHRLLKQDRAPVVSQFPFVLLKNPFEQRHNLLLSHLPQERGPDRVLLFKLAERRLRHLPQDAQRLEVGRGIPRKPPVPFQPVVPLS